ncbi:MAG TPA: molybdopterin-synthase adenylyltransferase MoeB [Tepidisphaeraceae bacterium]|nr:molybdopterin-synthase adenylyltransferase MoeB [Tepidisphaeraceae bacterium]
MTAANAPANAPTARPAAAADQQLSSEQINRYKRHLILPEVGMEGQKKLLNARVLCIGAGGLGCPISLYLAAAGVGTIGLVDIDVVSPSNLQRQILFGVSNVGEAKVTAAAKRLRDVNPDCKVIEHKVIVNASNVMELIRDYDVVIDGTDNFPTRYCVGDACVLAGKPNVYGSIFRFEGMVTVFAPHLGNPLRPGEQGPCYRCMYPEPPDPGSVPSCAEGGVIGVLPGIIGTLQANEVIKLILGVGTPAIGKLTTFSAMDLEFRTFKLRRDPQCPVCGDHPSITAPIDYEQFCGVPALDPKSLEETQREVHDAKQPRTPQAGAPTRAAGLDDQGLPPGYAFKPDWEVTPRQTKQQMEAGSAIVVDVREAHEWDITHIVDRQSLFPRAQWTQVAARLAGRENEKVIVHCKSGARSLQVTQMLRQAGFTDVKSMAGGILLWNKDVNPGGPQY